MIGWVVDNVMYWLVSSLVFILWHFSDLLLGYGHVFLLDIQFLACQNYLEPLVQIGCDVPSLLMRLSLGDGMIHVEGIMACPIG